MAKFWHIVLGAVLGVTPALGASDAQEIFASEAALAAALDQADLAALHSLLTNDVRIVRSESITFHARSVEARFDSLFGLSAGSDYSRSPETIRISQSGDLAFVTGTQIVTAIGGRATPLPYLSIWRRNLEFERNWRLSFDAPLEAWRGLDNNLSVDAVEHTPGLLVVRLAASNDAEQLEPAAFRQSQSHDLAYSVGGYYVPVPEGALDAAPRFGYFLATWENDGAGWRLLYASFPEPRGTSAP